MKDLVQFEGFTIVFGHIARLFPEAYMASRVGVQECISLVKCSRENTTGLHCLFLMVKICY